jgi:site-specific recombinase XerD
VLHRIQINPFFELANHKNEGGIFSLSIKRLTAIQNKVARDWKECLGQFLRFKKAQHKSELTIEDYRRHVNTYFGKYSCDFMSYETLKDNVYHYMSQEGIRPATYNNRLVYLKAFFSWCIEEGSLDKNPLHGFSKLKDEGRIVNIDPKYLKRLIELPNKHTFTGLRDYTLILLTLDSGIRPKEAFSLLVEDFNAQRQEVVVTAQKAKTRTTRILPISPPTVRAI